MSSDTIFISSHSSSIFTLFKVLSLRQDSLDDGKRWYCMGNSSLLLYFKCMGLSDDKILSVILQLDFLQCVVPGYNAMKNKSNPSREIKERISRIKTVFSPEITLFELQKFGFDLYFPVWDVEEKKCVILNKDNYHGGFLDAVLISLCNIGLYETYEVMGKIYSSMSPIDPIPKEVDADLYIVEECKVEEGKETPFKDGEIIRMREFANRLRYKLESIPPYKLLKYESVYHKKELTTWEKSMMANEI